MKKNKSPTQPKRAQSLQIFESVVNAGHELFNSLGFKDTTTNKIAQRAGVSIGSLYQYFPSKERILDLVIDRVMEENRKFFIAKLESLAGLPLREAIVQMVDASVDQHLKRQIYFKVFFQQIYALNKMSIVFDRRKILAGEMAAVFRKHFSEEIKDENLETTLFVSFNSFVSILEAYCVPEQPAISKEKLKLEVSTMMQGYLVK